MESKMVPVLCTEDCFACKQHIVTVFNEKEEWVNDGDDVTNIMHHDICTSCTNLAEDVMTKRELQLSCYRYLGLYGRPNCDMCNAAMCYKCEKTGYDFICCCPESKPLIRSK